jgi:hypothetical protein
MPIFLILILSGVDLVLATSAKSNLSYVAMQTAACRAQTSSTAPTLTVMLQVVSGFDDAQRFVNQLSNFLLGGLPGILLGELGTFLA